MAGPQIDDEEDKLLDPAVENVRRKLMRFVAVNLGLLFLALMAVVVAVVYKARNETPPAAEAPSNPAAEGVIALPTGARLMSQSLSDGRLSLDIETAEGGRAILLYDLASGRIVGRYAIGTE